MKYQPTVISSGFNEELKIEGKIILNVVPLSGSLSTSMEPSWLLIICLTTERPIPVPSSLGFEVTKVSKIFGRRFPSMPHPLSLSSRET